MREQKTRVGKTNCQPSEAHANAPRSHGQTHQRSVQPGWRCRSRRHARVIAKSPGRDGTAAKREGGIALSKEAVKMVSDFPSVSASARLALVCMISAFAASSHGQPLLLKTETFD